MRIAFFPAALALAAIGVLIGATPAHTHGVSGGRPAAEMTQLPAAHAASKNPRSKCRTRRQKQLPRCRTARIGKPGRILPEDVMVGRGGVGDQHLPFDNGFTTIVTQGNNFYVSHNNGYTRYGWDFGVRVGTTLRATMSGKVLRALGGCAPVSYSNCNAGWGNTVVLQVADGTCARYAHLASIQVRPGQNVARYDVIGRSGNSGFSTGAHLHYQRENCTTRLAVASAFVEAGNPRYPQRVTSQNGPELAPPLPDPPLPPAPISVPAGSPDRFRVTSYDFVGQGNYWAYTWWAWDKFTAKSNVLTHAAVVAGNPHLTSGAAVPYTIRLRICSAQPDAGGNCSAVVDRGAPVVNYGPSGADLGDVSVEKGRTYWLLANMPPQVSGRDWDTFWASTRSGKPSGQRDTVGQTFNLNAVVRGHDR